MNESITVLDVGHGNCAVVRSSDGVVLFDAGVKTHVLEYLRSEALFDLELIVISHSDADHIGGLIAILSTGEFRVKEICARPDSTKDSKIWDDLLVLLDALKRSGKIEFKQEADFSSWNARGGLTKFELVSPSPYLAGKGPGGEYSHEEASVIGSSRISSNSASIVVRIVHSGKPLMLLTGDMDNIALADIERTKVDAYAEYLVFPHHGGNPGDCPADLFTEKLVSLVKPNNVIFSIGRGRYNTPNPEIVGKIRELDPGCYICCTQLSKHCCDAEEVANFDRGFKIYSAGEKRAGCGGTLRVMLNDTKIVAESLILHTEFVKRQPTPLCRR